MSLPAPHWVAGPWLAVVGGACYRCHAQPGGEVSLKRCSSCRLVSYCGSSCQRHDWSEHKQFCRAVGSFKVSMVPLDKLPMLYTLKVENCQRILGRLLSGHEQQLVASEPRCLACGKMVSGVPSPGLTPCTDCRLSFACEEHWEVAHATHTQSPCESGHDGLSQCALNQELLEDDEWHSRMHASFGTSRVYFAPLNLYRWIPASTGNLWASVQGLTWADAFQNQLESEFPAARGDFNVWMRRMSESLSLPMTVLYGLELPDTTLDWMNKPVLTIHVIGAGLKELYHAISFETLLHRLPNLKRLEVVLCGPRLKSQLDQNDFHGRNPLICCSDCENRGRTRCDEYYDMHYEDLPTALGARYRLPDLAIAFNSGVSEPALRKHWRRTIAFLVASNIPSVFTSFTQPEAVADNALLAAAGAQLVPGLGPCRNPWGSMLAAKDVGNESEFFSQNMWLAGGFNAR
ncbi:hypothetical protein C8R46DRAFT_1135612 [Mycena filopes]|nr:hypothetical protein C8R46DRAFT_1135612 [Mycena filopes]